MTDRPIPTNTESLLELAALAGVTPAITESDRFWCTRFDRSPGFLEGRWDHGVTMRSVLAHRSAVEADAAQRIFAEVDSDTTISTEAVLAVYAAIKRALSSQGGDHG